MTTPLNYESHGSGEAVIFIHGFTLDRRMWQPQIADFAQHYRVIAYDQRGCGKSPLPTGEYSHTDDLAALLDSLQIESATLVGLSRGGSVALNFALAHPQRVAGLVLVDSVLEGHRWSEEQRTQDQFVFEQAQTAGIDAGKAAWLAHPLFAASFRQAQVKSAVAEMVKEYSGWHFVNRDLAQRSKPYASERLGEISCPTLAIVGEEDGIDFQQIAERLRDGIPNARKAIIANCGHLPNLEAPKAFNQLVLEFVKTI